MLTPLEKQCSHCRQLKPLAAFYRRNPGPHGAYEDGRDYRCKDCATAYSKIYRKTISGKATAKRWNVSEAGKDARKRFRDTEKGKAVRQRYLATDSGKLAQNKSAKISKARYPERYLARKIAQEAVRTGRLIRQLCHCGAKAEAHHKDYSKPLEVEWLCRKHHRNVHSNR